VSADLEFEDAMRARLAHFEKFPATKKAMRTAFIWMGFCPCGPRISKVLDSAKVVQRLKTFRAGHARPAPNITNTTKLQQSWL